MMVKVMVKKVNVEFMVMFIMEFELMDFLWLVGEVVLFVGFNSVVVLFGMVNLVVVVV